MDELKSSVSDQPETKSPLGRTVLVIDDNADLLMLSKLILEMDDYCVVTALGGPEALSILDRAKKPDLILLDFNMDGMSGTEFLTELEKCQPDIVEQVPVVFVTGMEQVPSSKAVGFIRKPCDMDKFLAAVHKFIEAGVPQNRYN